MSQSVIAYVPAIHQGYLNFLKKFSGDLFLIGDDLKLDYPRMERDIRSLSAQDVKIFLESIKISKSVTILNKNNLNILNDRNDFVLPDEDISVDFVNKYLKNKKIVFDSVFLRWDKHSVEKNKNIENNTLVSKDDFDRKIINLAITESEKSSDWWRQIGAVLIKDEKVILVGHNKPLPSDTTHHIFGDPRINFDYGVGFELSKFIHAEAGIIAEAAKRGISLEGASIYVSTFPCPVCAKLIISSGVKKIYFSEGYSVLDAEDLCKIFGVELIKVI